MENLYQGSKFIAQEIIIYLLYRKILPQFLKGFKEDTKIHLIY